MARKLKGGSFLSALEVGTAVYAATSARTYTDFLVKITMYFVVLLLVVAVAGIVLRMLGLTSEHFWPVVPSKEGDAKYVTPAGNVILY